jgi:23S rRNA G2445 N2-methylase RlmL
VSARREEFFAVCAPGLEPLLHEEVRALKLARVERQVGGVRFEGTLRDAWRANLELRTAIRVLMRVARFDAPDEAALAAGVEAVDWTRFLRPDGTLRVDARSRESALAHTLYVEQRTKDAVCDALRARFGARPSVDLERPDVGLDVHLFRDRCTLSVDTSGDSLHKRGWRRVQGRAPLAETFAAACVLASGWDRRAPLVDPFCGSGSILVEAGLLAGGVAPGSFRERFGFERWPGHDAAGWQALRAEARARVRFPPKLVLRGSDADGAALEGARENLRAAGVEGRVELAVARAEELEWRRGWGAWIVTNPPWGERVGEERELLPAAERFGRALRARCAGYHVAVLSGNPRLTRALGLPAAERLVWRNGPIEVELLRAELG